MIPNFTDSGLLPPGIHWATFNEVAERLGFNAHRKKLLRGLEKAIAALKLAGCTELYLDGSFVTRKDIPSDYDACWITAGVNLGKLDPVFLSFDKGRATQKAKYYGEFFPASAIANPSTGLLYLNFFQMDKETGSVKGIIGIKL